MARDDLRLTEYTGSSRRSQLVREAPGPANQKTVEVVGLAEPPFWIEALMCVPRSIDADGWEFN